MFKKTVIITIAAMLICGSVLADTYRITKTVEVRFAAGEEYDSFYQLKAGEEVPGREAVGEWIEINCYGFLGFIPATAAEKTRSLLYYGRCKITGYDGCRSCSPNGITACGTRPAVGRTAAIKDLKFGTRIYIDGIGERIIEDRGVGYGVVDVFVGSHSEAYALTSYRDVWIVEE